MRLFVLLCVLICSVAGRAEGLTFQQLSQFTQSSERLSGEFEQEKYLLLLDTALSSAGRFTYQRNQQINWLTEKPLQNELIITSERLVSRQQGQELMNLDFANNPAGAVFGEILFAVLTAEWDKLERLFSLQGNTDGKTWHAILVPDDSAIAQVMQKVELTGDHLLRRIVLHEVSGDHTTINFLNLQH